jgi:hypothetical protein
MKSVDRRRLDGRARDRAMPQGGETLMKTITVLTAAACVGLTVATVATAQLPSNEPWKRLEQADIPPGHVEVRPAPPNWKPRPVWNGYFGDDSYGNYHPKGAAPVGWMHPSIPALPVEVSGTYAAIGGETKTISQWMAIELLKGNWVSLQPTDMSPAVASPPAQRVFIPDDPVKVKTFVIRDPSPPLPRPRLLPHIFQR